MGIVPAPAPPLQPFVELLWFAAADEPSPASLEHVLPTGAMHLAIRLDDAPLILQENGSARRVGTAVIGGPRTSYYVKDITCRPRSVGAVLRAGAALPLFGAPASAFAEHHTALGDVWSAGARELRDELRAIATPAAVLDRFAAQLAERLPRVRSVHPAVAHALARFGRRATVSEVVDEIGCSHRRFLTVFRDAVGLSPKRYCRVQRLQLAIAGVARDDAFAAIAADAGYADQAHFTREFHELVGVSPSEYRRLRPAHDHHVQIPSRPG